MRNDIGQRLKIIAGIVAIILIGTLGYKVIGGPHVTFLDALYMTAITITTVGYEDVVGAGSTSAGKIFTIVYLFFSVGTIFYLFTALAAFMVEGEVRKVFKRRNMEKRIDKLQNHYIVCGIGMVGLYIVHELYETKRPQMVIDTDPGKFDLLKMRNIDVPVLPGGRHGERAPGKGHDKGGKRPFCDDELRQRQIVIALTAKQLNPQLRVICRCNDTKNTDKIKRAGADNVVALNYIGGLRMAAEMIRPHATDFIDSMLRDKEHPLRVEEVSVPESSPYVGRRIEELEWLIWATSSFSP